MSCDPRSFDPRLFDPMSMNHINCTINDLFYVFCDVMFIVVDVNNCRYFMMFNV